MNKKAFTLIELLAVIAILALVLLFVSPKVMEIIQKQKQKAYDAQAALIIESAKKYATRNSYDLVWNGNVASVTLADLIDNEWFNKTAS